MNARGQIAVALFGAYLVIAVAQGWPNDLKAWVQRQRPGEPDVRPPQSGFAPGAGAGGQDAGGGGGGRSW